ncbi:putative ABC transport system ATP-binding protein [Tamilnaduibacter salinus]|nr:ATP-binding cassette domain-containing protein [Tamilnaduibacter salinus]PVY77352.1 putative ABC transport system ATP-binding protein [Tamilnaduibacter salinus]
MTTPDDARTASAVLTINNMHFQWPRNATAWHIPDLQLRAGEHGFLHGASGSGKSTLLALLAGLTVPQSGKITLLGQHFSSRSRRQRDRLRADHIGIIFQQFNLVPYLPAIDNVQLPGHFSRRRRERVHDALYDAARHLLQTLAVPESLWRSPVTALSVGQQQRVAAARALLGAPELILADEPTSALDTDNRDRFLELLMDQARQANSTIVFVSHDPALGRRFSQHHDMQQWQEVPA